MTVTFSKVAVLENIDSEFLRISVLLDAHCVDLPAGFACWLFIYQSSFTFYF